MLSIEHSITILKDLRDHIIPLGEEELFVLERSILKEGCREPLMVWEKSPDQLILIDGHNRFKICQKNGITFKIKKIKLASIEEAKLWMIDNQIGRRNLTQDQMSYYRGLKYLSLKKKKGGFDNVKSKGQTDISTSQVVANFFNVSVSTVNRDARFAQGMNIIGRTNPKFKTKILTGESKVRKGDVQALADSRNPDRLTIKNEADLYNKAKIIKSQILQEVELDLKKLERGKAKKTKVDRIDSEAAFLDKPDRLRKIKGMILSEINRAINEKDIKAIRELKRLVDRLEGELFE